MNLLCPDGESIWLLPTRLPDVVRGASLTGNRACKPLCRMVVADITAGQAQGLARPRAWSAAAGLG